mgnify:CR=1 FL=1
MQKYHEDKGKNINTKLTQYGATYKRPMDESARATESGSQPKRRTYDVANGVIECPCTRHPKKMQITQNKIARQKEKHNAMVVGS